MDRGKLPASSQGFGMTYELGGFGLVTRSPCEMNAIFA